MEESEKRRERLRAMRMEASSQVNSSSNSENNPNPGALSNPLLETPDSQEPCAAPRFDFYTDPMAAFSGNKRPVSVSHTPNKRPTGIGYQNMHGGFRPSGDGAGDAMVRFPPPPLGPRHPVNSPYPQQQHSHLMVPNMETYQAGYRHDSPSPVRSPSAVMGPYPMHQGSGPCNGPYPYHPPRAFNYPVTGQYVNPHGPNPASPRPGHGWTPGPSPNAGRGRGQWVDRRGGSHQLGRGHHQRGHSSRQLYDKSMVEDPWKHMEPVVWKGTNFWGKSPVAFQRSSSDSKTPKVVEALNTSKQSLADYLASAFDDAVEETRTEADTVP